MDGRKLEGEILDANAEDVTIRRAADGKNLKVPLISLSDPDQKAVASWRSGKAMAKVTITATKDKISSIGQNGAGGSSVSENKNQSWNWVITIRNGTAHPLKESHLQWGQVVERKDRNQGAYSGPTKTVARQSAGAAPVPEIPPFGSVKISTGAIEVQSHKSVSYSRSRNSSGDSVVTATSYKWDEALTGLTVQLSGPGEPIRWSTGTVSILPASR